MKKKILLVFILGVSFTPAVFAASPVGQKEERSSAYEESLESVHCGEPGIKVLPKDAPIAHDTPAVTVDRAS